jgi:hypothetical protein
MPRARTKTAKTRPKATRVTARRKPPRRMLNGIPLKRKVLWTYDTDSPEFRAMWKKELEAIRRSGEDPEVDAFIEANLADPEVQKWWR